MQHVCAICEAPLKEGDKVQVVVRSTYHVLKSRIAYALDKADIDAIPQTLVHVACVEKEIGYDDSEDDNS